MVKKIAFTTLIVAALGYGALQGTKLWLKGFLPDKAHFETLKQTKPEDLSYLTENVPSHRGKILAVVTSTANMGENKATGYEHTELARAYWVFTANGFEVDIASPQGGHAPAVLDGDDMGAYDYAFLNDPTTQFKASHTLALNTVDADNYEAVYFVGGKGTMFDFPDNPDIQRITKHLYQNNKVISAVCHGPAALVNVQLDNGKMLLDGKHVSGFTNEEELILIPDAKARFGFLLQDKLIERGAIFNRTEPYLEQIVRDGKLITGQNPWSVWAMSEAVISELGYTPKPRAKTPEEYSVELLMAYEEKGLEYAKALMTNQPQAYQKVLILMHAIMAFMQFELSKGLDLISLANQLKSLTNG